MKKAFGIHGAPSKELIQTLWDSKKENGEKNHKLYFKNNG